MYKIDREGGNIPKLFNFKVTKPAFDFPPAYLGGADNQAVLAAHPSSSNNPLVFLDINLGGQR